MSQRKKKITMKDVAMLAGVSKQTVSAIINGKPGITAETTSRVTSAIMELGYRPNALSQSLRTGQTHSIALIVTDINNPIFGTIASAVEDAARASGYNTLLFNTHDDPEREINYANSVSQLWLDGVIFASTGDQITTLNLLRQAGTPTVAIDRIPTSYNGPSVTLDNFKTGQMAGDHLLKLGHRRLAHITGDMRLTITRDRCAGFISRLREAGLSEKDWICVEGNWSCASGYEAMKKILEYPERCSAVFAANDRMAIGAIQAVQEYGYRVPQDISVMGVDDIEVAAYHSPALTTIRQPFLSMASLSVNLLINIVNGKEVGETRIVIDPVMMERKSTAPIEGLEPMRNENSP